MKKFVKKLGALALAAGLVFGASFPTAQAAKEFHPRGLPHNWFHRCYHSLYLGSHPR